MEIQPIGGGRPVPPSPSTSSSSSSSYSTTTTTTNPLLSNPNPNNPMQSWWESISKARSRIQSLSSLLPSPFPSSAVSSLADSDRPARSLLDSPDAYLAVSASLSSPSSGSGDDPLCQWLYETYQSSDPDLRLVVLSFIPLLSGLYLSRVIAGAPRSLAGFEAVLLALYAAETKARAGKPLVVSVPDLSQPSLYHTPRPDTGPGAPKPAQHPNSGVLCPPLEPQIAVKSTKRACIIAVALDCYYKKISVMPNHSKADFCEFTTAWAGQDCACRGELDQDAGPNGLSASSVSLDEEEEEEEERGAEIGIEDSADMMNKLAIRESPTGSCGHGNGEVEANVSRGCRVPLPWELLQPILRILGHCLLGPLNPQEVKDAASVAVRAIYARASHDIVPQAILASRSLIRLDRSSRLAEKAAAVAATSSASNPNTPTKPRKPEILLVSK